MSKTPDWITEKFGPGAPSQLPEIVEARAFALYAQATNMPSGAHSFDAWQEVWRGVDELTKERFREQASREMQDWERRS